MLMTMQGEGVLRASGDDAPSYEGRVRARLRRFVGPATSLVTAVVLVAAPNVVERWLGAMCSELFAVFLEEVEDIEDGVPYVGMVRLNEPRVRQAVAAPVSERYGLGRLFDMRRHVGQVVASVRTSEGDLEAARVTLRAPGQLAVEVSAEGLRRVLETAWETLREEGGSTDAEWVAVWVVEAGDAPTCMLGGSTWTALLDARDPTEDWHVVELQASGDTRAAEVA